MKNLPTPTADTPTVEELRRAFDKLTQDTTPRWGRMRAAQMTRHCRVFIELCLGRVPVGWPIRGLARLFGPMFLRRMLAASPRQAPKNLKTLPALRADEATPLDLDAERRKLSQAWDAIEALPATHRHPLYGTMRSIDVVSLVRHHTAHHANQFGLLDGTTA